MFARTRRSWSIGSIRTPNSFHPRTGTPNPFFPRTTTPTNTWASTSLLQTLMTLSFSNCSSAFFIVCAALLACNDWRTLRVLGEQPLQVSSWTGLEVRESLGVSELR